MADKRMFSKGLVDGDDFLDMPPMAQLLYFHLGVRADDDGFLNNAKRICGFIGASTEDMSTLIERGYLIPFERGVVAIRHWKVNNLIRGDRYKPTAYVYEKEQLEIGKDGIYTLKKPKENNPKDCGKPCGECEGIHVENTVENYGIPNDHQRYTQGSVSIQDSIGLGYSVPRAHAREDEISLPQEPTNKGFCISEKEEKLLVEKMGYIMYQQYAKKLEDFIIRKNARVYSCADTILKWYNEDLKRGSVKPYQKQEIGFDLDEFFNAAVNRTNDET